MKRIEHGFTWFRIVCLVLTILFIWGIRYGSIIAPQVRATANKVVQLNNLENVHLKVCGMLPIDGNL